MYDARLASITSYLLSLFRVGVNMARKLNSLVPSKKLNGWRDGLIA